ncbi:integrase core domain-containing protein [Deinococcus misasensis]|uniref:integrase core domain-containing protein n=1 Tax=Deinococcus misasensis TaxID=392413 RepID=UPI003CCBB97E
MSRKGNCWDNAVVESFFATLKLELALHRSIGNREETCRTVFSWVEGWYNRRRLHSSLGFCSPVEFEEQQCG